MMTRNSQDMFFVRSPTVAQYPVTNACLFATLEKAVTMERADAQE
jgi:hypothetical protein